MIRKIAIVIVLLVVVITTTASDCGGPDSYGEALKACLRAGYSEARGELGDYFCYRLVNGTEEIVPLEDVME